MMLNPVFRKDMRVLFRNKKVYIGLTVYLIVLALITNGVLNMFKYNSYNGFDPEYIMGAYLGLLGFQMVIITFVVPAFTSSSITGERERQTFDFLVLTRMKSIDIVVGKLMSSIMLVCLLIVAAMPIYAIIFYYGGVSIIGFIVNTAFLIIYSAFIGSISILFSTLFKKTAAAAAMSNLFVIGLSIGTMALAGMLAGIANIYDNTLLTEKLLAIACVLVLSLNPVVCFISIVDSQLGSSYVWEALSDMLDTTIGFKYLQAWHLVAVAYIVITFFLLKIAAKNILPKERIRRVPHSVKKAKAAAQINQVQNNTAHNEQGGADNNVKPQ